MHRRRHFRPDDALQMIKLLIVCSPLNSAIQQRLIAGFDRLFNLAQQALRVPVRDRLSICASTSSTTFCHSASVPGCGSSAEHHDAAFLPIHRYGLIQAILRTVMFKAFTIFRGVASRTFCIDFHYDSAKVRDMHPT